MRTLIFAKRNLKEILRDPLSLIFCFVFPVLMIVLMEVIVRSTNADLNTIPQFKIESMFSGMCIFGFAFLTLFSAMNISRDRNSSFQARLNISPMKPFERLIGYMLALIPLGFIQIIIVLCTSLCFGLSISWNILLAILGMLPSLLLFIGLGVIIGILFNEKTVGGISSLVINLAILMGGMFFPLETMNNAFSTICNILPFAPGIKIPRDIIRGTISGIWVPIHLIR